MHSAAWLTSLDPSRRFDDQQALLHRLDESRERLLLCGRVGEEVPDQTIRFLDGPEGMALVGDVDADADHLAIARAEHGMQLDEHAAA